MEIIKELVNYIETGDISNFEELEKYKMKLAKKYKTPLPKNSEIIAMIPENVRAERYPFLKKKPTRTLSGVAVIAVMTSPSPCPHGKCSYCPGGVEINTAQSYTGKEPAAMRAIQNHYDPYFQTKMRILQLQAIGHSTSKLDIIVMGGTFTARSEKYQYYFIKGIYDALNETESNSLKEAMYLNESAAHRAIGLTIETRPDWFDIDQIDTALSYGATRVELGVQSVFDEVLNTVKRGHTQKAVIRATQLAKDAGFKVGYHMMPGLPGSNIEKDLEGFKILFENENYRPDMLKIYPTLVIAGTELYNWWKNGEYRPYTTEEVVELMYKVKKIIPRWIRIQRIQRDIPASLIVAGVKRSDIRSLIQQTMHIHGEKCNCIRCREIGHKIRKNEITKKLNIVLKVDSYHASNGLEKFITIEDENNDALIGYLRLRFPSINSHRPELQNSAIVRELKVVGPEVPLNMKFKFGFQHQGFGKKLMHYAEYETSIAGYSYILVNSGVGARNYYRKLGYKLYGPYMRKRITS